MRETDLYDSVKSFLEGLGFSVQAEVKDCDVVGQKDGALVVVELKRNLSVRLLTQGVQRQRLGADVYLAVPKPLHYRYDKKHRELLYLLSRLELGLLYVSPEKNLVEPVLHPQKAEQAKSIVPKKKAALLRELHQRQLSQNQGGSTKVRILTAYREQAIYLACALSGREAASAEELAGETEMDRKKISSILNRNYYRWFERVERGRYALTEEGQNGLSVYSEAAAFYREKLHKKEENRAESNQRS